MEKRAIIPDFECVRLPLRILRMMQTEPPATSGIQRQEPRQPTQASTHQESSTLMHRCLLGGQMKRQVDSLETTPATIPTSLTLRCILGL